MFIPSNHSSHFFLLKIVNRNKVTAMKVWTNWDSFTQYNYLLLSLSWYFFHLLHYYTRWSKLSLKIKCVINAWIIYIQKSRKDTIYKMVTTKQKQKHKNVFRLPSKLKVHRIWLESKSRLNQLENGGWFNILLCVSYTSHIPLPWRGKF